MTFIITGYLPPADLSSFMNAMDLGIAGVQIQFCHKLSATLRADAAPAQIGALDAGLRLAYERAGAVAVTVTRRT